MYKCEYCGKIVKSSSGLKRHISTCKAKKEVEVGNDMPKDSIESTVDICNDKKIQKLLDLRKSTYDAHTRNLIDMQINELRG